MPKRIIAALSAGLDDGREVVQGEEVDLSAAEVERFEASRTLVPEGFDSFQSYHEYQQDAYRGGRGDVLAAGRMAEARRGGIVDLSRPGGGSEATEIADYMREAKPTVEETVALANGDPDRAATVLEAEKLVTGGEPRTGVEQGLQRIIDGAGE